MEEAGLSHLREHLTTGAQEHLTTGALEQLTTGAQK